MQPESSVTAEPLLVNSREAARLLSLSERSLWSLSASGEIPRIKVNKCVRYSVEDLRDWIARKKKEGCQS